MSSRERRGPANLTSSPDTVEGARADRLARFRGPVERHDAARAEFWRGRSDADHARAMIELARYAETVAASTGYHKDADDMFPGFPAVTVAAAGDAPGERT